MEYSDKDTTQIYTIWLPYLIEQAVKNKASTKKIELVCPHCLGRKSFEFFGKQYCSCCGTLMEEKV